MTSLTQRKRAAVSELLKDSIVHLCRLNALFEGHIDVDGIIVISGQREGEEVVVKVHERLQPASSSAGSPFAPLPFLPHPADRSRLGLWAAAAAGSATRDDASALKAALRQSNLHAGIEQEMAREPEDLRKTHRAVTSQRTTSPPLDDEDRSLVSSPGSISSPSDGMIGVNGGGLGSEGASPYGGREWGPNESPECHVCSQTFDSVDALSEHNETLHNAFTCPVCHKTFTSRSNLERHARLHTGHKPYVCTICQRSFSRKDHLVNHATKHAFKCGVCSKRFTDRTSLTTHFFHDHNSATVNVCPFCNKGFADYASYEEHAKIHPQFNTTDKNFNLPAPLFMLNRRLQCRNCSFVAADKLSLAKHQLIHGNQARTTFTCLACTSTFADPLTLTSHMEQQHAHETSVFECLFCHLVSPTLAAWKRHELDHVTDAEEAAQTHMCRQCDKVFLSQSHLLEHLAVHDMARQPFPSPVWMKTVNSSKETSSTPSDRWARMLEIPGDATRSDGASSARATPNKAARGEDGERVLVDVKPDNIKGSGGSAGKSRKQGKPQKVNKESSAAWDLPVMSPLLAISAMAGGNTLEYRPTFYPSPTPSMAMDLTRRSNDYTPTDDSMSEGRRGALSLSSTPSKMSVDIPTGPHICTICNGAPFENFQLYETHCLTEHNRSPCMFCVKTFAQKANRDRHVCLHTGDKPYACPYCEERFSRGDKLKLHKTRVHKIGEPSCPSPSDEAKVGEGDAILSDMGLLEGEVGPQPEVGVEWSGKVIGGEEEETAASSTYQWTAPITGGNVHEAGEWQEQVMDTQVNDTHAQNGDQPHDDTAIAQ
jgi:uncharacterized Zn-finger protein